MFSYGGRRYALRTVLGLMFTALAAPLKSLFAATNPSTPQTAIPRVSDNQTVVRNMIEEVWNQGNVASIQRYIDARGNDCGVSEDRTKLLGGRGRTYEEYVQTYRKAFPDLKVRILSMSEQGNVVTVKWTAEGSHQGDLPMVKATGRQATVSGTASYRVVGGKISAMTAQWNTEHLSQILKTR
jgi:predicted ester cyclase